MNPLSSDTSFLYVKNLSLRQGKQLIFHQLNWSLKPGKWTCLLGQSGVGKTSLLRLLAHLPASEQTKIEGQFSAKQQISYLGQNDGLLPWLSVFDNACLCTRLRTYTRAEKETLKQRAAFLLKEVGLEKVTHLYPRELSGGMRQRVALVRALTEDKSIFLLDEPFSRLDAVTALQLQNLAARLLKEKTVLLVTHDPQEALRLADSIDLLSGRPATIENLISFTQSGPRDITSPELLQLQKKLYRSLSKHYALGSELHQPAAEFALKIVAS